MCTNNIGKKHRKTKLSDLHRHKSRHIVFQEMFFCSSKRYAEFMVNDKLVLHYKYEHSIEIYVEKYHALRNIINKALKEQHI